MHNSRRLRVPIIAALALVVVGAPAWAKKGVELKVGDTAPDFELLGSDGKTYTLSQFKGKQNVALAFFPKAFTSR